MFCLFCCLLFRLANEFNLTQRGNIIINTTQWHKTGVLLTFFRRVRWEAAEVLAGLQLKLETKAKGNWLYLKVKRGCLQKYIKITNLHVTSHITLDRNTNKYILQNTHTISLFIGAHNQYNMMQFSHFSSRSKTLRFLMIPFFSFSSTKAVLKKKSNADYVNRPDPDIRRSISSGINIIPWTTAKLIKIIQDPRAAAMLAGLLFSGPERGHTRVKPWPDQQDWQRGEKERVREKYREGDRERKGKIYKDLWCRSAWLGWRPSSQAWMKGVNTEVCS